MAREASIAARGAAIATLVAVAAALCSSPAVAGAAPCKNGSAQPGSISRAKLRRVVVCLIDRARSRREIKPLRANSDLDALGQAHAKLMVAKGCFRHRCGNEPSVKQRFEQSPYVKGATSFRYSEELAYEATPRQMVKRLLASANHRSVIVDAAFQDIGVGARRGAPVAGVSGRKFMTYTLEFGARTR